MVSCKVVVQELKPLAGHSKMFTVSRTETHSFDDDDESSNRLAFESLCIKLQVDVLCSFVCCISLRMCPSEETSAAVGTVVMEGTDDFEDVGLNYAHVEKSVQQALSKVRQNHGRRSVSSLERLLLRLWIVSL